MTCGFRTSGFRATVVLSDDTFFRVWNPSKAMRRHERLRFIFKGRKKRERESWQCSLSHFGLKKRLVIDVMTAEKKRSNVYDYAVDKEKRNVHTNKAGPHVAQLHRVR